MEDQRQEAEDELKSLTDLSQEICRLWPPGVVTPPFELKGHICELYKKLSFFNRLPSSLIYEYRRKAGDVLTSTGLIATLCEKASHWLKDKGDSDACEAFTELSQCICYTGIQLENAICLQHILPLLVNLLKESYFEHEARTLKGGMRRTLFRILNTLRGLARVPENRQHLRGLPDIQCLLKVYSRSQNELYCHKAIVTMAYLATDSRAGVRAANPDMVHFLLDQLHTLERDGFSLSTWKSEGVFIAVSILAEISSNAELLVDGGVLPYLLKGLDICLSWKKCSVFTKACSKITDTLHKLARVKENRKKIKDNRQLLDCVVRVYRNKSDHLPDCFESAKSVLYRLRSFLLRKEDPELRALVSEVIASYYAGADDSSCRTGSEEDSDGQDSEPDTAQSVVAVDQSLAPLRSETPKASTVPQGLVCKERGNAASNTAGVTGYQSQSLNPLLPNDGMPVAVPLSSVPRYELHTSQPGSKPNGDASYGLHRHNPWQTDSMPLFGMSAKQSSTNMFNNAPQPSSHMDTSFTENSLSSSVPPVTTLQQGPSATIPFSGPPGVLVNHLPFARMQATVQAVSTQHMSPVSQYATHVSVNNPSRMLPTGAHNGNMLPVNIVSRGTPHRMPDAFPSGGSMGNTNSTNCTGATPGARSPDMPIGQMGMGSDNVMLPRPALNSTGSDAGFETRVNFGSSQARSNKQTDQNYISSAVSDMIGRGANVNSSSSGIGPTPNLTTMLTNNLTNTAGITNTPSTINNSTIAEMAPPTFTRLVPPSTILPVTNETSSCSTATASTGNDFTATVMIVPSSNSVFPTTSTTLNSKATSTDRNTEWNSVVAGESSRPGTYLQRPCSLNLLPPDCYPLADKDGCTSGPSLIDKGYVENFFEDPDQSSDLVDVQEGPESSSSSHSSVGTSRTPSPGPSSADNTGVERLSDDERSASSSPINETQRSSSVSPSTVSNRFPTRGSDRHISSNIFDCFPSPTDTTDMPSTSKKQPGKAPNLISLQQRPKPRSRRFPSLKAVSCKSSTAYDAAGVSNEPFQSPSTRAPSSPILSITVKNLTLCIYSNDVQPTGSTQDHLDDVQPAFGSERQPSRYHSRPRSSFGHATISHSHDQEPDSQPPDLGASFRPSQPSSSQKPGSKQRGRKKTMAHLRLPTAESREGACLPETDTHSTGTGKSANLTHEFTTLRKVKENRPRLSRCPRGDGPGKSKRRFQTSTSATIPDAKRARIPAGPSRTTVDKPGRSDQKERPSSTVAGDVPHDNTSNKHFKSVKQMADTMQHKRNTCPCCRKDFISPRDLETHMKTEKHFKCPKCEKCFSYKKTLAKHTKDKHDPRKASTYECKCDSKCNKQFECDRYLKEHEKKHKDNAEESYKCEKCNKGFKHRSSRLDHMKRCKKQCVDADSSDAVV